MKLTPKQLRNMIQEEWDKIPVGMHQFSEDVSTLQAAVMLLAKFASKKDIPGMKSAMVRVKRYVDSVSSELDNLGA